MNVCVRACLRACVRLRGGRESVCVWVHFLPYQCFVIYFFAFDPLLIWHALLTVCTIEGRVFAARELLNRTCTCSLEAGVYVNFFILYTKWHVHFSSFFCNWWWGQVDRYCQVKQHENWVVSLSVPCVASLIKLVFFRLGSSPQANNFRERPINFFRGKRNSQRGQWPLQCWFSLLEINLILYDDLAFTTLLLGCKLEAGIA